jgi:hypothetical protein
MEAEVAKAIADLDKRIKYQESIHLDINTDGKTKEGFIHGIMNNLPLVIATVVIATCITLLVTNEFNKKINNG